MACDKIWQHFKEGKIDSVDCELLLRQRLAYLEAIQKKFNRKYVKH